MKNNKNKYVIQTGIGLQDVDHLKNSSYFLNESQRYINGEISIDELNSIINSYYKNKPEVEERTEEADKIAIRIAKLISENTFTFSVGQLLSIHHSLFKDVLKDAGKLRNYNFSKKEWVLDGESVIYGDYRELEQTLIYDFSVEKQFKYSGLSTEEIIDHLCLFIGNLWQIHPFSEGNTRTTAVFVIKYLRSLGYNITNETFSKNSWYFRNALVRANYNNASQGIFEDKIYLKKFLQNLLENKNNVLLNRELHIGNVINVSNKENRESKIIQLMLNNPRISTKELSETIGVSLRTIKSVTSIMQKTGLIQRVNGKKLGFWKTNKQQVHDLNLQNGPFEAIKSGLKKIEMRLYDEKRSIIAIGDIIIFTNAITGEKLTCLVKNLYRYKNFKELYKNHKKSDLGYKDDEIARPEDMGQYYSNERIQKYGVLGIEIVKM